MNKYYRVKKDTFIWEKGAILKFDASLDYSGGYRPVEDIWNHPQVGNEYISAPLIENNPEWFERVYADSLEKMIFKTKDQLKEVFKKFIE